MKLIVADDHEGLRAAARRVFNVTRRRCRVAALNKSLPAGRGMKLVISDAHTG